MRRHYLRVLLVVIVGALLGGACLVRTSPGHSRHEVSDHKHQKQKHAKHKKHKKHKDK